MLDEAEFGVPWMLLGVVDSVTEFRQGTIRTPNVQSVGTCVNGASP